MTTHAALTNQEHYRVPIQIPGHGPAIHLSFSKIYQGLVLYLFKKKIIDGHLLKQHVHYFGPMGQN